ncbi:Copper transport protein [Sparassis crispa]|uniref:Copper transport protein n=1 Tax=Sparassis crispa TaxID=139825 RepID=A0A401GEN9_9APHY|nr:Copper transport protein [Sparassis crispa]GBE80595.1 Copper transport protein [Sparassis crispa]
MNMLWNYQIVDTCVVFREWHVSSNTTFALSFLAVVALGALYEWLRSAQRALDCRIAAALVAQGKGKAPVENGRDVEADSEDAGLLTGVPVVKTRVGTPVPLSARISRAALYAATVFLSFFLMLVFMTYNAYLILAVVIGAGVGHFVFGSHMDVQAVLSGTADVKGMACH